VAERDSEYTWQKKTILHKFYLVDITVVIKMQFCEQTNTQLDFNLIFVETDYISL